MNPQVQVRKQIGFRLNRHFRLFFGLAVSGIFLWLALRNANLSEVLQIIPQIRLPWLLLSLFFLVLGIAAKVWRWQLLFAPLRPSWADLLSATMIGFLVNTVLPGRLGEVARIYLVRRDGEIAAAHTLSTIFVERVLDGLTLLLILTGTMMVLPAPPVMRRTVLVMGIGGLAVFVVITLLALRRDHGIPIFDVMLRLLPASVRPWVRRQLLEALNGLAPLRTGRLQVVIWAWSLVVWSAEIASTYLLMLAFELPVDISGASLLTCVLNLGMLIPSSAGYIGVYHFLAQQTLVPFGISPGLALGYAFMLHLTNFGLPALGGFYFLVRRGIRWDEIRQSPAADPVVADASLIS